MSDDTLGASRRHLLNVPCLSPASVSHRSLLCSMSYVYHDTMYTSQDRWVLQRSPGAPSFETPARRPNPTPLRRAIHPHPPPFPALNDPLGHTGHNTRDGGSAGAGQALGSSMPRPRWSTAPGPGTYGGGGVGRDGQRLLGTPHRQVRRLRARRAAPRARTHASRHRHTAFTARWRDTWE